MDCGRLTFHEIAFDRQRGAMQNFIHQENIAFFKRRLAEPCTDAVRKVVSELLAREIRNDPEIRSRTSRRIPRKR